MNTEMGGSNPVEISEKRLSLLHSRLFPDGALSDVTISSSPQRPIIHSSMRLDKESNSVSTLEDFSSPSKQGGLATTPNSSRSRSNLDLGALGESENSRDRAMMNGKDSETGMKRQRDNETDEQPLMKSPTLKVVDDQNESGSRGAAAKKNTLTNYFASKNGGSHPPPATDGSSFFQSSTSSAPLGAAPNSAIAAIDLTSAPVTKSSSNAKTNSNATSTVNRNNTSSSNSNLAALAATNQLTAANTELKKELEAAKLAKDQAETKLQRIESELRLYQDRLRSTEDRNTKLTKCLEDIYRKMAMSEFRRKREKLALDCVRLGKIIVEKSPNIKLGPASFTEYFVDGYAAQTLHQKELDLKARKEILDERKKQIMRLARVTKKVVKSDIDGRLAAESEFKEPTGRVARKSQGGGANSSSSAAPAAEEMDMGNREEQLFDISIDGEVIRSHLEQLKRDEQSLVEERRLYETEKAVHQRELKRCMYEEKSNFARGPLPNLHDRYLLQSLLGKGGFSEVWKAMDLVEMREVAVKVHQLNPHWNEERKQSYIKHVTREYTIHRDMKHPRIVQLFDVFEISVDSFATVLDYCPGIDLDEKLKRNKTLPEKDAKIILQQILSGLRYLNRPLAYLSNSSSNGGGEEDHANGNGSFNTFNKMSASKRLSIIHYDLKPANILFDETGDVKITDFGLSKIIDESEGEGTSMELTSQGAGTYWYLPPECFAKGHEQARISSKVDVWSAGVIFYQMLYGFRPYGEGKTQENVWSDNLIRDASPVEFPSALEGKAPKVSEDAKELIRECLTRDQRQRPDIIAICQNKYFAGVNK